MIRPARVRISLDHLAFNCAQARHLAPHSSVMAVIKADAYGHGAAECARILQTCADALAVATPGEACDLRDQGIQGPLVVLHGVHEPKDLQHAIDQDLQLVIHDEEQITLLEHTRSSEPLPQLWLKINTGMHRLGINPEQVPDCQRRLEALPGQRSPLRLMTHLACADETDPQPTQQQLARFAEVPGALERSAANSAALLHFPDSHLDWVRPGLMLYGIAPTAETPVPLRPVMTFEAPLLCVRECRAGDRLGYGATYTCPTEMRIGLIEAGYADGYPRIAGGLADVAITGQRHATLGRVSMDLIAIDLTDSPAKPGDWVELWGPHIGVQHAAEKSSTIAYELLCQAGAACRRQYIPRER